MLSKKWALVALFVLVGSLVLTACEGETKEVVVTKIVTEKETVVQTVVQKETVVEKETVTVIETVVPTIEKPDTLVICIGQEPDTLYIHGGSMLAASQVLEAVYDGPFDNRTFAYQTTILEKLPSLADGDAVINTVTVQAGDTVYDAENDAVVTLEAGVKVRPAGCRSADCAIEYDGSSPLEMDQMVVTFKLREGMLWSDGEPLTAYDSVYSFELQMDPDTPAPSKYTGERTASYEALDDVTAVWTSLPGFIDATFFINFWTPLPEHVLGGMTALEIVESEEASRMPLGWGAYVIDEWVAGDHISLHKNPNYWRADEGLPKFENVIYRIAGENSNANIASLLSGECDIVDQTSHLDDQSELLLELQASGQVNATFVTGTVWEHADYGINSVESYDRPDFFEDVRVRQALLMCMDRQSVVDTVMFGQSIVLDSYLPPEHPLFNPEVRHYDFDVEAGSALLEEVGWIDDDGDPATPRVASGVEGIPDGTLLEFNYWTTSATQRVQATQVLQASLAQCGVKVNLEYWNAGEYFADGPEGPVFGRRFDIAQFAWLTGVQPPCNLYITSQIPSEETGWAGQNDPGFSNAEFDAACNAALQSLPGTPEEAANHLEAQRIFGEQVPVAPLYLRLKLAATRPDMKNFIMDPTANSEMWNIEEFDIGE